MSHTNKIIFVEKEADLMLRFRNCLEKWNVKNFDVTLTNDFNKKEIKEADCVIIDCNLIEDIEASINEIKELAVKNIVIILDRLNHPISHKATLMEISVFYKHSPITALLYKINGAFKCYKEIPEQIDYKENENEFKGKMIAVHSPVGGTGKTTISINLAIQYAMKDLKVLLIDFSTFGNFDISLNLPERNKGLSNIIAALEQISGNGDLTDINSLLHENIVKYSKDPVQIDILPAVNPLKIEKLQTKNIEHILETIRRMEYDVVIIDTSPELNERNLALFEMVDEILIAAIPDVSCGWKIIQLKEILEYIQIASKCKLVINKYSKRAGYICRELELELQYPLIGIIPESREIQFQNNQGKPIGLSKKHKLNRYFRYISHQILPIFSPKEIKLGRFLKL